MKTVDQHFISQILPLDIQIVNIAFSINDDIGMLALTNCMSEFRQLLVKDVGLFINGMNMEWRFYVLELLDGIDERFKESATIHIISPKEYK